MARSGDYWGTENLNRIASTFDAQWYLETYGTAYKELKRENESPLDFYLRIGGRMGHDPHEGFSELFFRTTNPKVYNRLIKNDKEFGYLIYPSKFRSLLSRPKIPTPAQCLHWRALMLAIDQNFVASKYLIDGKKYISPLDFYVQCSRDMPISPTPHFSEESYRKAYPDVDAVVQKGDMISGFHHFVLYGVSEGRNFVSVAAFEKEKEDSKRLEREHPGTMQKTRQLEQRVPGLSHAIEIDYVLQLDFLMEAITIEKRGAGKGYLVFVPYFVPEIFFGGYLAFFKFLKIVKRLQQGELKLVLVRKNQTRAHFETNLEIVRKEAPDLAELFSSYHLLQESRRIEAGGDYGVISFCAETHFVASDAAKQLNVSPVFFIQDYEPDFHPAGTLKTFKQSAFDLPHVAVYNSRKLYEFFRDYASVKPVSDPHYKYATFENVIKPMPWDWNTFQAVHQVKDKKRLVIYARPESLGTRNEFAIIIHAIKKAIAQGYLDSETWVFQGIGSMLPRLPVQLAAGCEIEMIAKMPLREYEEYLLLGDVGISLISTPHPGIIHFQMASYGLASVTYQTPGRSAAWLKSQSDNLIPSDMTIDGLCDAIRQAVELSSDLQRRYANAVKSKSHTDTSDLENAAKFIIDHA